MSASLVWNNQKLYTNTSDSSFGNHNTGILISSVFEIYNDLLLKNHAWVPKTDFYDVRRW